MDTSALNGLRGLLSLHVMLAHYFNTSKYSWFGPPGSDMNIFYLLSGFSLGLTYINKSLEGGVLKFYKNRMARIIPVFYLIEFLGIYHAQYEGKFFIGGKMPWRRLARVFSLTTT